MSKTKTVAVMYTARMLQHIEWPDDEFEDFNKESLESNLDTRESETLEIEEIKAVTVDFEDYEF